MKCCGLKEKISQLRMVLMVEKKKNVDFASIQKWTNFALRKMKQRDFTMLNENLSGFFLIDPTLLEISLTSVLIQDNGGVTSSFPVQSTRLIK